MSTSPEPFAAVQFNDREGCAVVTGAGGGIGAACAATLAARGSRVALVHRSDSPAIAALTAQYGAQVRPYRLELTDATACAEVLQAIGHDFGSIHTLAHAAGPHVRMAHLSRVSPAEVTTQIADDLGGFLDVALAVLPYLRASRGNIVVVTTAATTRFPVRDALSAIPKGGIEAAARALAAEEGRFGIRVNCVGPGMLTDGMAERLISSGALDEQALEAAKSNIPLRGFGSAQDVAEAVAFLASDAAGFISGQKLDVDGGYGV